MAQRSETDGFRVIIAGGGIAGLTLANCLQHAGIDYVLLEARSVIAPQVGASIGMMPNGSRILDQLGCYDEIAGMIEPMLMSGCHYETGEFIGKENDGPQLAGKRHGYEIAFLDRQLVLEVLSNHVIDKSKILLNKRLESVEHTAKGVTVCCKDGTSYSGDILAGADGVFSKVRQEMWRAADHAEPEKISATEKGGMKAEYQCLFGISTATHGLPVGRYDVTFTKDFSTMAITGKNARVFWFLFKRMDKVYSSDNIPKFTKEDAEAFGERHSNTNLMPGGSVTFGEVWKNRTSYTLVATEEAQYKHWTWGRFACLGDSIHKMTPNAGTGGNAAIESAAALANSVNAMLADAGPHPSITAVKHCLMNYQQSRQERISAIAISANNLTRIHALRGIGDRITAHYIIPIAGDHLMDLQAESVVGATSIDYLPPPLRALNATCPFNPEQGVGKKESVLFRAFIALPFLGLVALALTRMDASAAFPAVGRILQSGSITWNGGSVPVRNTFYHIKWLDDLWRPVTILFAPWNLEIDPIAWWQMLTFITDFGLLYSIMLIESVRRANLVTFAQLPVIFGLAAQLRGIGIVGPVYYFLHYASAQISNFKALDHRLTDLSYTRSVLPAMIISYYIPHFLSHLHPSLETRHGWNWIWQMFPVWVMLIQRFLAYTVMPDTIGHDRLHKPKRDLVTIRYTIGACMLLSAFVWLYTLTMSPFSLLTIFVPHMTPPEHDWVESMRNFVQWDHIFCFGSAYLWLAYLFNDLKRAGMVQHSWLIIVGTAVVTTLAFGPGVTVGLGWLCREDVLANKRHKGAIVKGWEGQEMKSEAVHANGNAEKQNGHVEKQNGHIEKQNGHAEKQNEHAKH